MTRGKLQAAEAGTGPEENVQRFRKKLAELEVERANLSGLEPAGGSGAVLPPVIREVFTEVTGPCAAGLCFDGAQLVAEGTSRSGPFYHLAGIAGGDYYVYVLSVR